ncbi:MAG: HNH endonuclease family protein [Corynebacterium sp.]|uniref:HNH endonuclease family protein n=1 Tax=Corynebacterium sp. TaxID=1720 RepID=UPI0026DD8267|nr:HNH endonuclease family protein [Corynebacterium sp.]MDO5098922.1 HNH endonuclease family protein [Corynebacterium sp.]
MRQVFSFRVALGILIAATLILAFLELPPAGRLSPNLADVPQIRQRSTVIGYDRKLFGDGWAHNPVTACSTRQDVLRSQLTAVGKPAGCRSVVVGICPYSNNQISSDPEVAPGDPIEVDHIFPLAAAWDMGAFAWPEETRIAFANDPLNLVAVSAKENRSKSDLLPSDWLPPARSNRCWYVNRLTEVAAKYNLFLSTADVTIMRRQCLFR